MTHTKTSTLAFILLQNYFANFQLNQKSMGGGGGGTTPSPSLASQTLDTCGGQEESGHHPIHNSYLHRQKISIWPIECACH